MISTIQSHDTGPSTTAMKAFLNRLLPGRAGEFDLVLTGRDEFDAEAFELSGGGSEPVLVRASTTSALTAGFNWYLKHYANGHVSWCGSRLDLPRPLPSLPTPVRIDAPYQWRYYFNYCTFSYSMAWWDWERWEREIDWMALAGINLPLAVTGQEIVWQRVYRSLGLTDEEITAYFAGPAFLAWGWMGNLDSWGGPLPQSWIDGQSALQKRILARQRELGMKPVLPAFTGHVPPALTNHYPQAKIKQMKNWAETFPGTYILDQADPLFQQIGHLFIQEQQNIYGTDPDDGDHFYSCDTFNENSPPDSSPEYLTSVGKATYEAMAGADPKAVWVLQDWMFFFNPTDPDFWQQPQINALLESVPGDRLLVLDLHSDGKPLWRKTESLCGKPWVWCLLHSFGGHQSMHGNLARLAHDPPAALADAKRGQLVGFGLTAEGIDQNPMLYDLATDMMWRRTQPALSKWIEEYAMRRYGDAPEPVLRSLEILRETVYSRPGEWSGTTATLVNLPPRLSAERVAISYPPHRLIEAWEQLAKAASLLGKVDPYRYDLIDLGRQVFDNLATALHARVNLAYNQKDLPALKAAIGTFLAMFDDMDRLLATRGEFLLGRWLEAAKAIGTNDAERRLYEHNARMQITLWGNRTSMLRDYARKEWSGMIGQYYRVRWERFCAALVDSLTTGVAMDEKAFHAELRKWEEEWSHQTDRFPTEPSGDSIETARELLAKYRPIFADLYRVEKNLATNKPVCSSPETKPGNGPELATTGVVSGSSYWAAEPSPQWLEVDLLSPTTVDSVHVFPFFDGTRSYQYTVETSLDRLMWREVVDASKNTAKATVEGDLHAFAPHAARYVRVHMLANSVGPSVHLLDFRIYGQNYKIGMV